MAILDHNDNIDIAGVSTKSAAMRTGLYLGLAGIVFSLIYNVFDLIDYSGQNSNMLAQLPSWLVYWYIMYLGIKSFRDNELGGRITLGKSIGLGTLSGVIWGVITLIFTFVFFTYIQPDAFVEVFDMMQEQFEENGMDEDAIDMAMSVTKKMMTPVAMGGIAMVSSVVFGFIMSLILGAFMKTE